MTKTDIILIAIGVILLFKLIKEIAYIRLYAFIIRLKADGKLKPVSDPYQVAEKAEADLKKNSSKFI